MYNPSPESLPNQPRVFVESPLRKMYQAYFLYKTKMAPWVARAERDLLEARDRGDISLSLFVSLSSQPNPKGTA